MITLILMLAAAAENPLEGILGGAAKAERSGVEVVSAEPDLVTLRFAPADTPGRIVLPVPAAARDWTGWGTFSFEFVSTSTIRFGLQIRNRQGQSFGYRVQPYQDVRARAAIPITFFTREYMNNRQFKGHWLSNWGNHIDIRNVESLALEMQPNREVTLRIGRFALLRDIVADEILSAGPVVDEFGQWIRADWPGKVRSLDELKRAWATEDRELAAAQDFGYSSWGGWKARKERASGFFHTAQIDGRWWLVDPGGYLFFSVGPDCVRYRDPSRVIGREKLFAKLPPGTGATVDFYQANARLRYGETDFLARWKASAERRLKAWGFNTVANWSDPAMFDQPQVPFVNNVRLGAGGKNWQGFPDVYSPKWVEHVHADAQAACRRYRDEPYLIGWFIGNEPRWHQRNLIDLILADPEESETQKFVRAFPKEKDRDALMEALVRRCFQVHVEAIRKADPNHLVLGIRWAGSAPDPVLRANDVFDVFSINIYRFQPPAEQIERIHRLTGRPIMIGEFHFGAAEHGYAPSLVMVKDQAERGVAYRYYVERAAALAPVVGAHYFQMVDQPVSGRFDGENYNLGLVTQTDLPYRELAEAAKATHRRMYAVHAGEASPGEQQARVR